MNLNPFRRTPQPLPAPCSWCRAPAPDGPEVAGWTAASIREPFVARYEVRTPLGGVSVNSVNVPAGPRRACPPCADLLAAGAYLALAARGDGPAAEGYVAAVAARLTPTRTAPKIKETAA